MKYRNLMAALVFTSACMIPIESFAACIVCWGGSCFSLAESSCNEVSVGTCFTMGAQMFRPSTDYVLTEKGRAWLVQGTKRTPFASDSMSASFKRMVAKYPEAKSDDPKIKKEREAAWAAFFKTPDNGATSPDVLSRFSREMGLSVRQGERAR